MTPTTERRFPSSSKNHNAFEPVNEALNEERAAASIEAAVSQANEAGTVIDTAAARLIAATIHRGPTSALAAFAATGALNHTSAVIELWDSGINEVPIGWWRALDLYFQTVAPATRFEDAS